MLNLVRSLRDWPDAKGLKRSAFLFSLLLVLSTIPAKALSETDTGGKAYPLETVSGYTENLATYNWNLSERQRPLLSLPDQISPNVDLTLSYPMARFAFPLFQSLYFNKRSDEYLLMLVSKHGRRAELVGLLREGQTNTYSDHPTGLELLDKNNVKIVRSSDGIEYTFSRFADGEFRCSQVNDRHSAVLTLAYGNDALLQRIAEDGGRTVRLSYESGRFHSITQTWTVNSSLLTRTWTIADESLRHAHADSSLTTLISIGKVVPSNAITTRYSSEMAESDRALARIFGDPGAVAAANGFEPQALARQYPLYRGDIIADNGRILRGHLSFAMHLYGSADGRGDSAVYVPVGFTSHSDGPSPTDAAVTFYYPRLGNLTNVTLAVFHVANFGLRNEAGRVRIGNIGGPGGSSAPYKHSHIEFYRGNTGLPASDARPALRIDPVSVFDLRIQLASRPR